MVNRVNIGCGKTPTNNWINSDNSFSIYLANSPIKYRLCTLLNLLNDEQINFIDWIKENNIKYADATKNFLFKV